MRTKKLKIKNIPLKNNVMLAPMAGFTDIGFRSLAYKFGVGLATCEMVSAKALLFDNEKTKDLLIHEPIERPIAVQLFGHEPEVFAKVLDSGVLDDFDIIDLNMGCPAPKIFNNGDGCALMKNLNLASEIIKTCVAHTNKPVTVKFRSGVSEDRINAVEFAKMCEKAGASAVTIHGRTREQYYSGTVNKDIIKDVVDAVKISVIANGDIRSVEDAKEMLNYTKASGIMVGRGALGNLELLGAMCGVTAKISNKISKFEQVEYICRTLLKYYNETMVLNQMRGHLVHFVKGQLGSTKLKQYLLAIDNLPDLMEELKVVFSSCNN